jgi:hypothetical protein
MNPVVKKGFQDMLAGYIRRYPVMEISVRGTTPRLEATQSFENPAGCQKRAMMEDNIA